MKYSTAIVALLGMVSAEDATCEIKDGLIKSCTSYTNSDCKDVAADQTDDTKTALAKTLNDELIPLKACSLMG